MRKTVPMGDPLPGLFTDGARRGYLESLDRNAAIYFAARAVIATINKVSYDPGTRTEDKALMRDMRFRTAMSATLGLSIWSPPRISERFVGMTAQLSRHMRVMGKGGVAGLVGDAALSVASLTLEPGKCVLEPLTRVLNLCVEAEVLHALVHGQDAGVARSACELRLLTDANSPSRVAA